MNPFVLLLAVLACPFLSRAGLDYAPVELSFTASRELPWRAFVATAVFTQGERRVEVDAFWETGSGRNCLTKMQSRGATMTASLPGSEA